MTPVKPVADLTPDELRGEIAERLGRDAATAPDWPNDTSAAYALVAELLRVPSRYMTLTAFIDEGTFVCRVALHDFAQDADWHSQASAPALALSRAALDVLRDPKGMKR